MQALIDAAQRPGVGALIDQYYDMQAVQGFALGVHASFVAMYRSQYGSTPSISEILETGLVPSAWPPACAAAGLPDTLSAVYIVIYVTGGAEAFRRNNALPTVTPKGGDHLVLVEAKGPFLAFADRSRHRPQIQGGISIGNAVPNLAGTLGGFVEEQGGDLHLLSCCHVLEDPGGMDIVQQGKKDGGGAPRDIVATNSHVVGLKPPAGFSFGAPFNAVDAALARVSDTIAVDTRIRLLGRVVGIVPRALMSLGENVVFVGKESDRQEARVYRFIARLKVTIGSTVHNFGEVFEIEPRLPMYVGSLAQPGDSGSWVVRDPQPGDADVAGVLFAGSGTFAVCCFMETTISEIQGLGTTTLGLAP